MAERGQPPPRGGRTTKSKMKLTFKLIDPNQPRPTRQSIFETTHTKLDCYLTGLADNANGFLIFTDQQTTIDNLTSLKGQTVLKKLNLTTVLPPYLRAQRNIFISGLDKYVGDRPANDIRDELTKNHQWLTNLTIHKIPNRTNIIKLQCNDLTQADRILTDGLTAFHTRFAPHQCKKEQITEIQICFKCYKFESHSTNDCPSQTIHCSECAQTGHTHRQCQANYKKCLNCTDNNNHSTMSNSCPKKKQAKRDKEQRQKDETVRQSNKTYSSIIKTTIQETTPPPRPIINLTDKTQLKLVAIVLEAHIAAIGDHRPYSDILSESLRLNYDIDVRLPQRDSQKILDLYMKPTQDLNDSDDNDKMDETTIPPPTHHCSPTKTGTKPRAERRKLSPDKSPQKSKQQKQEPKPQRQQPKKTPTYKVSFFRSDQDPTRLPDTLTDEYIIHELKRTDYGLKNEDTW